MPTFSGLWTFQDNMYWDQILQVSGSDFTTTSTTLVNITGLSYSAVANSVYEVEVILAGQSSSNTGVNISIAFSGAGGSGVYSYYANSTVTGGSFASNPIGTSSSAIWTTTTPADSIAFFRAFVRTTTASGNITAQIDKSTSGTATVFQGSVLKVKKLQ